jgi:hypothetical protein
MENTDKDVQDDKIQSYKHGTERNKRDAYATLRRLIINNPNEPTLCDFKAQLSPRTKYTIVTPEEIKDTSHT